MAMKKNTFISCGIGKLDETRKLLDLGASGVCIDVAHGHSDRMFYHIQELKKSHPDHQIMLLAMSVQQWPIMILSMQGPMQSK